MSIEPEIRVVRRGDHCEVGGNWWKTLLLIAAMVGAFIVYKKVTAKAKAIDPVPSAVLQPITPEKALDKQPERGADGLFPLSGS